MDKNTESPGHSRREHLLADVLRARADLLGAKDSYRAAIQTAWAAGISYKEMGDALGLTRQAVEDYAKARKRVCRALSVGGRGV